MANKPKRKGWHGDPEGHSKAGKASVETRRKKLLAAKQVKTLKEEITNV